MNHEQSTREVIDDLRRSLGWLDLALASLNEGVLVLGPDLKLIFANDALAELLGTHRLSLLGRYLSDVLPLASGRRDLSTERIRALVNEGNLSSLAGSYKLLGENQERLVELSLQDIPSAGQIVAVVRDVTGRHLAEQQRVKLLQEQAARMAAEAAQKRLTAQHLIARVLSEAETLEEAVAKILRIVGEGLDWDFGSYWTLNEESMRLRCLECWHRDREPLPEFARLSREIHFAKGEGLPGQVWERGAAVWATNIRSGPQFPRFQRIKNTGLRGGFAFPVLENEEFIGVMEFFGPKSEAPHEETLTAMATTGIQIAQFIRRRRLERQKDEFLAIAAHELRTPVTSLKVYAQHLERRFRKEGSLEAADRMRRVNDQVTSLSALISDLLDVTKIETGHLRFRPAPFELDRLIEEVVADARLVSPDHHYILSIEGEPKVFADRERVRQVLGNLIDNARKYSPPGREIHVAAKNEKEKVVTEVTDQGPGIPPDEQMRLFERFYRVGGGHSQGLSGLGLGLYISAEIVKRSGGRIWIRSAPGKGATFSFSLPRMDPEIKTKG